MILPLYVVDQAAVVVWVLQVLAADRVLATGASQNEGIELGDGRVLVGLEAAEPLGGNIVQDAALSKDLSCQRK